MGLEDVAVAYIRENRAGHSDAEIRRALAGQGFSAAALDAAFAAAGPRPAAAPPAPRPARRRWPWVLGAFLLLLGAWAVRIAARVREGAAIGRELQNYHPAPLSEPQRLAAYLPSGLLDEDAGPDFMELLASLMRRTPDPTQIPALTPEERAILDRALTKSRCSFSGAALRPVNLDEYVAGIAAGTMLNLAAIHDLRARTAEREQAGDLRGALELARRTTLLGWHLARDWDLSFAAEGGMDIQGGVLTQKLELMRLGEKFDGLDMGKAILDVKAYVADADEAERISRDAGDPAKLPGLVAEFSTPERRRAYGLWTLFNAAANWSQAELDAAQPDPGRERVIAAAREAGDPRLTGLADVFERSLPALAQEYRTLSPEQRLARRNRFAKIAPPTNY